MRAYLDATYQKGEKPCVVSMQEKRTLDGHAYASVEDSAEHGEREWEATHSLLRYALMKPGTRAACHEKQCKAER
eukprot:597735-Rhodomonas_salina.1